MIGTKTGAGGEKRVSPLFEDGRQRKGVMRNGGRRTERRMVDREEELGGMEEGGQIGRIGDRRTGGMEVRQGEEYGGETKEDQGKEAGFRQCQR